MLGEQQRRQVALLDCPELGELLLQRRLQIELLLQPDRHGCHERAKAVRSVAHVGLEQPLELHEGFVVEDDPVDFRKLDSRLFEAVADGVSREPRVVLLAREAFLLGGCNQLAFLQQGRGAVVIVGGQAEDISGRCVAHAYILASIVNVGSPGKPGPGL